MTDQKQFTDLLDDYLAAVIAQAKYAWAGEDPFVPHLQEETENTKAALDEWFNDDRDFDDEEHY